jgi:hypothetical protein
MIGFSHCHSPLVGSSFLHIASVFIFKIPNCQEHPQTLPLDLDHVLFANALQYLYFAQRNLVVEEFVGIPLLEVFSDGDY